MKTAQNGPETAFFLTDNGSLRPEATLGLRVLADQVSRLSGIQIEPVSLLHSSRVPADRIGGRKAEILEPAIKSRYQAGIRRFRVQPLFFGPSAALTEYIPARRESLTASLPGLELELLPPLAGGPEGSIRTLAVLLADLAHSAIRAASSASPPLVLVDHGTPQRAVSEVRDQVARALAEVLGDSVAQVLPASMERRSGEHFDFNEPLLEKALHQLADEGSGPVVLSHLFFLPGRHAGPGGDIAEICKRVAQERGLTIHRTPLLAEHPGLARMLAERVRRYACIGKTA